MLARTQSWVESWNRVKDLPEDELNEILDARKMTEPGIPGGVMMPGGG